MNISIVIPVYNEEQRINRCISALTRWNIPKGISVKEILFVDDGSIDNSKVKIQMAKVGMEKNLKTKVKIISYRVNRGKGYAVKTGMLATTGDYTLFMDCDISTPLSEFKKFLPAMNNGVHVIVGTRKNGKSTVTIHQPKYREVFGKCFTYLSNIILNTWVTDFTCGFKAFSKYAKDAIFTDVTTDHWGFDAESLFIARQKNISLVEVPVLWANQPGSKVHILTDGPRSFVELIQMRVRHMSVAQSLSFFVTKKGAL